MIGSFYWSNFGKTHSQNSGFFGVILCFHYLLFPVVANAQLFELDNTSINENQEIGSIVGTIIPFDENDEFTYLLPSGQIDNDFFSISDNQLLSDVIFDYEDKNEYFITIQSIDENNTFSSANFTIAINNLGPSDIVLSKTSVEENLTPPSLVGIFSVPNSTGPIEYTFVDGAGATDNNQFTINNKQLIANISFDYESKSNYNIRVQATDTNNEFFIKTLSIAVINLSEGPNDITLTNNTINENEPAGTIIGEFEAIESTGNVTYSLPSMENDNDLFSINGNQLLTNATFDFEVQNSYTISVTAQDDAGELTKDFTISVNNLVEAPTDITLSASIVDENQPVSTPIGNFSTTGGSPPFTYQLVSGIGDMNNSQFVINGDGLLTNAEFDFETQNSFSIRAQTTDDVGESFAKAFTISVNDLEEAPTDITLSNNSIEENAPINTPIGTLSATDVSGTVTFSLPAGEQDNDQFTISADELQSNATFDFETQNTYTISVAAQDDAGEFTKDFNISVLNVEEAPTNLLLSASDIDENQPVGTPIGSFSSEGGTAPYSYALVSGEGDTDNALFSVNDDELVSNAEFDFETQNTYSIRVQTTDDQGENFAQAFAISVNNLEEGSTDITLSNNSIEENAPVNTPIGNFTAISASGNVTFSLPAGEQDNDQFTISADELQSNATFDFETQDTYTISVTAQDDAGAFTKNFSINVTDLDENITALSLSNNTVNENQPAGTVVGSFTTEGGTSPYTYEFEKGTGANDNDDFNISTNQLTTGQSFDFEAKSAYAVRVKVTDSQGVTFEESFDIQIIDLQNPTSIALNPNAIEENQPQNALVGTLSASGGISPYTFELITGEGDDDNSAFTINNTNQLFTNQSFDFETQSSLTVRVSVTDKNQEAFAQPLNIAVTDRGPSNITLSNQNIQENKPSGTQVGEFSTEGGSSPYTYTFVQGTKYAYNLFNLAGNSLETSQPLDYEEETSHIIKVNSEDAEGESFSKEFTIGVEDVVEAPIVVNPIADFSVDEDASNSTFNLNDVFSSTDPLTFSVKIESNVQKLLVASINSATLTLDYLANQFGQATITVTASDGSESIDDAFVVTVNPVNDPPTTSEITDVTVDENSAPTIINLNNAFDDLEDADDALTYTVTGNTEPTLITPQISGSNLTLTYAANQFGNSDITVQATDTEGESVESTFTVTVNEVNDAPIVSNPINDLTVNEEAGNSNINLSNVFSDPDGDPLTYTVSTNNENLINATINNSTLTLGFVSNQFGQGTVTVTATDPDEAFVQESFLVTVNPVNDPPITTGISDITVDEDAAPVNVNLYNAFEDVEDSDDKLIYQVVSFSKQGLVTTSVNNENLAISFVANQHGSTNITVKAEDTEGASVQTTFKVTVNSINDAPTASTIESISLGENAEDYAINIFNVFADVEDTDAQLSYEVISNSNGALVSTEIKNPNLILSFTPNTFGSSNITIKATDTGGKSAEVSFTVSIADINNPPSFIIVGNPAPSKEDAGQQKIAGFASDINDGDDGTQTLTFNLTQTAFSGLIAFANGPSIDPATGDLTYTAKPNAFGTADYAVTLSDNGPTGGAHNNTSASQSFSIVVQPVADSPTVPTGVQVNENETASDLVVSRNPVDREEVTHYKITNIIGGTLFQSDGVTKINNGAFITSAQGSAGLMFAPGEKFVENGSFKATASTSNTNAGLGGESTATLQIIPTPDKPVVTHTTTQEDTQTTTGLVLERNENDGDEVKFFRITNITGGQLFRNNGTTPIGNGEFIEYSAGNAGLKFTPSPNATSNGSFVVQAALSNFPLFLSDTAIAVIKVTAVNDAPVVTAPTSATVDEETTVNIPGISIADVDLGEAPITVDLSVENGVINLAQTTGITFDEGGDGTGSMKISGSLASVNAALNNLSYTGNAGFAGEETLAITAEDNGATGEVGGNQTGNASVVITVNPVNDPPVLSGVEDKPLPYNEDDPATNISATIALTDDDSETMLSASVKITSGYVQGEDVLIFPANTHLTGSFNANTGELKLTRKSSGTDFSTPVFQSALRSVQYQNTNTSFPATDTRTITFIVTDDLNEASVPVTKDIVIAEVNDPPQLANIETDPLVYVSSTFPKITNTLTVTDVDQGDISSATIKISQNYQQNEDVLSFTPIPGNPITGNFFKDRGELVLQGVTSIANYQAALRNVTYFNLSAFPSASNRLITFAVRDTDENRSNEQSRFLVVGSGNIPPAVFDFDKDIEEDSELAFEAEDFLDAYQDEEDSPSEIRIRSLPQHGTLMLDDDEINDVSGEGHAITPADLNSLVYIPDENYAGSDNFKWNASDGESFAANDAFVDITIDPINDDPTINAPSDFELDEDVPTVIQNVNVEDPDAGSGSLTVKIIVENGLFSLTETSGLSFKKGDGELDEEMEFDGTLSSINAALNTLTYLSAENSSGSLEMEITVKDNGNSGAGGNKPDIALININVLPVNDPPALADIETEDLDYTENDEPLQITNNLTITDVDDPDDAVTQATITIVEEGYTNAGEELLSFTPSEEITGEQEENVLTLTGTATMEAYLNVIKTVKYENQSNNPGDAIRTISIQLTDEKEGVSNIVSRNINVTPVNDPPQLANIEEDSLQYFEGNTSLNITSSLEVGDPDSENISSAVVQIAENYLDNEDSLSLTGLVNINATWDSETGTLILSGTDTKAAYQEALRKVKYHNVSSAPDDTPRVITFQINDEESESNTESRTLIILPNAAPTVSNFEKEADEDASLSFTLDEFSAHYDDDNIPTEDLVSIQIITLPQNGMLQFNETEITQTQLDTSEVIINAEEIELLTYLSNANYNGEDSIGWSASDGIKTAENQAFVLLTINPVNDPPLVNAFSKSVKEDSTVSFTAEEFNENYSDPDNDGLQKIIIRALPTHGTLKLNGFEVALNSEISTGNLGKLIYQPALNYNGEDSISWSAADPFSVSTNSAAITFVITPVNDAPVLSSFTKTSNENAAIAINLEDFSSHFSDIENDELQQVVITRLPLEGNLTVGDEMVNLNDTIDSDALSNFAYIPDAEIVNGKDNFRWIASDGSLFAVQQANVNIIIGTGVSDFEIVTDEDSLFTFSPAPFENNYNHASGEMSAIRMDSLPQHGSLSLNDAAVTEGQVISKDDIEGLVYLPDEDFNGKDSLYWNARNGGDFTPENAKVLITVLPVNDAPTLSEIENQLILVNQSTSPILFAVGDPDSDQGDLVITVTSDNENLVPNNEENISVEIDEGLQYNLTVTPLADSTGTANITIAASDGKLQTQISFELRVVISILEVEVGPDRDIFKGESVEITAQTSGGDEPFTFTWTCDQAECAIDDNTLATITVSPSQTTTYYVKVEEANGQIAYDTVTVNVTPSPTALDIPSGFTPDGREPNNLWLIEDIEFFDNVIVEVYNRYGTQLFRSEGYREPWDGTYNGDILPVGTYYYVVNIDNGDKVYKGTVVILR